jgi:hypothetical protein
MKVDKFTLKSATSENKYAATGVSGLKGTDASTWRISKAAKIDMEFEVPVAALTDMRKYPAVLAMENLTMNNMPATGNNLFKSMVKDFHTLDSLCGTSAETTLDLQLRFAEDTSSSTGTVFYGQPLTSMNLVSSKICNIAFLNDLVFEWTAEPSAEYRVAGTVGSADNLVFTSLQKVERVFGFPASFMFGDMKPTGTNLSKRMEDAGIVLPGDGSIGGAIGAYSVWCAFGVTDCMRETDPSPANGSIPPSPRKSTIHFNRIPSKYFVAFAPLFLEKSQMINYFRIRFQIYASYETAKPTLNSSTEIVNVRLTYIP